METPTHAQPVRTYRDVFTNTHHLLAEAEHIHELQHDENIVELYKLSKKYGKEHPGQVLSALQEDYFNRMLRHAKNPNLIPPGKDVDSRKKSVFQRSALNAVIEVSSLKNWENPVQFQELKDFVDELLKKK